MTKDEISLLKHIISRGKYKCLPEGIHDNMCKERKCPIWNMCKQACDNRPARVKEAQRLLNMHTSILAKEGEY